MSVTSFDLAPRLSAASIRTAWDVYSTFDWPETLPADAWCMSPELISLYGTQVYENFSLEQQKRLSFTEICNFFSLVLQGERPLVQGLVHRLYLKQTRREVSQYLHHFIDEENKHMIMFGNFCHRYMGKVYPEKKITLTREYAKGEEEVMFFCKVLAVEEIGDYYNVFMMNDERIHPLVREINRFHHLDETRHLAFGRLLLAELWEEYASEWSPDTITRFRNWLTSYVSSSWGDYYNPSMYRDAGLANGYELRQLAIEAGKGLRKKASEKLVGLFLSKGMLEQEPEF